VWIIGNDQRVTIIDPAHDVDKIATKGAGRTVGGVRCFSVVQD